MEAKHPNPQPIETNNGFSLLLTLAVNRNDPFSNELRFNISLEMIMNAFKSSDSLKASLNVSSCLSESTKSVVTNEFCELVWFST